MDRAYIPLNLPNTLSIVIMGALGFFILGAITASLKAYMGGPAAN